jgi:hypothetical protein
VVTEITAGSTERTSSYFGDQTPSESKKPCFPSRVRFYHFWRTPLSQPLLDQKGQSKFLIYRTYSDHYNTRNNKLNWPECCVTESVVGQNIIE